MCKAEQIDKIMLKIVMGPFHLFNFVLLANDSRDLPLDEKKITVVKNEQIHKMTTFNHFEFAHLWHLWQVIFFSAWDKSRDPGAKQSKL